MGKKRVTQPTAAQKAGIVHHLRYELTTFRAVVGELPSPYASTTEAIYNSLSETLSDALTESAALHTRNLTDFFYTPPKFPTDAIADHLVRDVVAWHTARPPITSRLQAAKTRADKQVSHLTYDRVGLPVQQRRWPAADLLRDLEVVWEVFMQHADPAFLTP